MAKCRTSSDPDMLIIDNPYEDKDLKEFEMEESEDEAEVVIQRFLHFPKECQIATCSMDKDLNNFLGLLSDMICHMKAIREPVDVDLLKKLIATGKSVYSSAEEFGIQMEKYSYEENGLPYDLYSDL